MKSLKNAGPAHRALAVVAVAAAAALAAAGCASSGDSHSHPASVAAGGSVLSAGGNGGTSSTGATGGNHAGQVPVTAYLSVTQNYFTQDGTPLPPGPRTLRYAVTDKQVITKLAALINALPVAPKQLITPCPSSLAPAYALDFQDSSTAAPVAEVAVECFGVMVTLHGQNKPILSTAAVGENAFLQQVGALLAGSMPRQ